jgi:biotin carboxyl carrier protein
MKFETLIRRRDGTLRVEGSQFAYVADGSSIEGAFSIEPLDDGCYAVLLNGRSLRVSRTLPGEIQVNGIAIPVEIFDPRALKGRGDRAGAHGPQKVLAPMPGKVVRVLVAVGDAVEAGQGLVVVEAMKMQNEMKSPKAGRVAEVRTKPEAAVSAGEILVVVE